MKMRAIAFAFFAIQLTPVMAQNAPKVFFEGDVVRGAGPTAKGAPCVLNSQFKRGETLIFRIRLVDPATGNQLDAKAVKSLNIELSNGEKIPMSFHGHSPKTPTDFFWSGGMPVSPDQPTGSFTYKAIATTIAGETVTWSPFNVASSQLTIVE